MRINSKDEYELKKVRLDELKDIDDWDCRVDEYNALHDEIKEFEDENNICNGEWLAHDIYRGEDEPLPYNNVSFTIIGDIDPYRSTITGENIAGRRQHREHLRKHGYEEIGTDNIDEAKKDLHVPPQDDKKQRTADTVRAYDKLASQN